MDENHAFYVGVTDPIQLRRLILECSKQILQSLQDYEALQTIREEKIEHIIQLRHIIKEVYSLNSRLALILPKAQLRASQEPKVELEVPSTKAKKQDIESFDDELKMIEEKLRQIGA